VLISEVRSSFYSLNLQTVLIFYT